MLFRSIQGVMERLSKRGVEVVVHEPTYDGDEFEGYRVLNDFDEFTKQADVIVANRMSEELEGVKDKVYTRDIFNID